MGLKLAGECKTRGVSVFSVAGETDRRTYNNLDELFKDFLSGLRALGRRPGKILIYQGSSEIREYMAMRLKRGGYTALNRSSSPPKRHPGMGMYVILLDYFLERTVNQAVF